MNEFVVNEFVLPSHACLLTRRASKSKHAATENKLSAFLSGQCGRTYEMITSELNLILRNVYTQNQTFSRDFKTFCSSVSK